MNDRAVEAPPVADRRRAQQERQRTRLVLAAGETFVALGYATATVADILKLAGMSRRSFYEFFTSKEDVLLALLDEIVVEVRNEIVHPMPFPTGTQWNVPNNLFPLHEMGLLISTGKPDSDYTFSDKVRSYALGYWCWEVVETCVTLLVEHLKPDQQVSWTAQNFSAYKNICHPNDLPSIR